MLRRRLLFGLAALGFAPSAQAQQTGRKLTCELKAGSVSGTMRFTNFTGGASGLQIPQQPDSYAFDSSLGLISGGYSGRFRSLNVPSNWPDPKLPNNGTGRPQGIEIGLSLGENSPALSAPSSRGAFTATFINIHFLSDFRPTALRLRVDTGGMVRTYNIQGEANFTVSDRTFRSGDRGFGVWGTASIWNGSLEPYFSGETIVTVDAYFGSAAGWVNVSEFRFAARNTLGQMQELRRTMFSALGKRTDVIEQAGSGRLITRTLRVQGSAMTCKESACFLTTAAVHFAGLPDNCWELQSLRQLRDNVMRKRADWDRLIDEYERIAPKIVEAVNARLDAEKIWAQVYLFWLLPSALLTSMGLHAVAVQHYKSLVNWLHAQQG